MLSARILDANRTLLAEGDAGAISQFFTSDYRVHLTGRDMQGGHEGVRKYLEMLARAFPSIQVDVEILVEAEDRIAWLRTLRGVQEGSIAGFPACGREIVWRDMVTSWFRGGLIAEEWVVTVLGERLLLAR